MASPNANHVKQTFKVFCKAHPSYSLAIRDGRVILAKSNPTDESQHWYKEDYGTRVKDVYGFPSFALVNKATGQAIKHAVGNTHPVQLKTYRADVLDESILWTEATDWGGGFRAIRMANNVELNMDASFREEKSRGGGTVHTSTIGLWQWHGGDNQLWKIVPTVVGCHAPAPTPTPTPTPAPTSAPACTDTGKVTGGNVTGATFTNGNFAHASLTGANTTGGNVIGATVTNACLTDANTTGGNVNGNNITSGNVKGGNVTGSNVNGRNVTGGNVTNASLTDASTTGGNVNGNNITGGNVKGGNVTGSNVNGGNVTGGNVTGGNVNGGNVTGGNVNGGNVTGGNVNGGNVTGGNVNGGNVTGGNVNGGNVTGGNVNGGNVTGGNINGANVNGGNVTGGNINNGIGSNPVFPSMASPNDEHVKGGYWYCDKKFPTPVASIPSQFFTHLFAAFAEVNPTTYEVTFPKAHKVQFSTFTLTVQRRNPNVITLLSIGGVSSTSTFASLTSHPNTRESFIHSSINLARSNDFHGLSLHWLYPSTEEKMTNLGSLLDEWRAAVDLESKLTGNDPLLLVAAVNFRPTYRTFLYPVDAIARSLDWINLVAYDFYNPAISWNATGPFAALLRGHIKEITPHCADPGVSAWIHSPVTAQKIVLGLPFYGVAWHLEDAKRTEIFSPADGPVDGQAVGVYIDPSDGTILYNQIKYFINTHPGGNGTHNANYVLDYFSAKNTWIGYNDTRSIITKVTYARENKLLGYYAWHVGGDRQGTLSRTASIAWGLASIDNVIGGNVDSSNVTNGDVHGGNVQGGNVQGGNVTGGDVHGGNVHGGNVHGGNVTGSDVHGGNIHGGNVTGGNVHNGNIIGGNIHGGKVQGGNVHGGNVNGSNVHGGNVTSSNITGSDVHDSNVDGGNVNGDDVHDYYPAFPSMALPNANHVKQTFNVFCKAHPSYSLAIQDGRVILAKSNPSNESQHWYKEDYGTRVTDVYGLPSFALVNKATGQAIKHAIGNTHPVQLKTYNAHALDKSILWTEATDWGGGFRAIRMTSNVELNMDASFKEEKSRGGGIVRTSTIGLWQWHGGDNQLWKIVPTSS